MDWVASELGGRPGLLVGQWVGVMDWAASKPVGRPLEEAHTDHKR
jgi:hypothetical protein